MRIENHRYFLLALKLFFYIYIIISCPPRHVVALPTLLKKISCFQRYPMLARHVSFMKKVPVYDKLMIKKESKLTKMLIINALRLIHCQKWAIKIFLTWVFLYDRVLNHQLSNMLNIEINSKSSLLFDLHEKPWTTSLDLNRTCHSFGQLGKS